MIFLDHVTYLWLLTKAMQARQQYFSIGISFCSLTGKIPSSKSMFSRRLLSQFFFWGLQGKAILSSPVPSDTYTMDRCRKNKSISSASISILCGARKNKNERACAVLQIQEVKKQKQKKQKKLKEKQRATTHWFTSNPPPHFLILALKMSALEVDLEDKLAFRTADQFLYCSSSSCCCCMPLQSCRACGMHMEGCCRLHIFPPPPPPPHCYSTYLENDELEEFQTWLCWLF